MLVSAAFAADAAATATGPEAGAAHDAFVLNIMLIVTLVVMFYFMMIVPQQKRLKRHQEMLKAMKKGDEVVTSGGLIGKIDKIKDGDEEVVIDLGNGVKVTALRSTIQARPEKTPANDVKPKDAKAKDAK